MQHSLFDPAFQGGTTPDFINKVMAHGANLAASVSGGKDSDAMFRFVTKLHRSKGWEGQLFALFCELGRIEWAGVTEHLHKVCAEVDVPLVKLHPKRSMVDEWEHRYQTILAKQEAKPFWSSASSRFCTKHEKVQTADKDLRKHNFVVCAVGLRAEESSARAKKPRYQVRDDIAGTWYKTPKDCKTAEAKEAWAEDAFKLWLDSSRKGRFALTWHPIHHWSLEEVWRYNGTSSEDVAHRVALYRAGKIHQAIAGFPCHWAYAIGNTRLSCSMCVLASQNDILNGAKLNPWTWAELALMEIVGGWGFQQGRWLASLSEDVLALSFKKRDRLYQILDELGLIERWHPKFAASLIQSASAESLMFCTDEAFLGLTAAIANYWNVFSNAA